jgi:hypothetical protein
VHHLGPMAQWIRRRSTEAKIPGSTPGRIILFLVRRPLVGSLCVCDMRGTPGLHIRHSTSLRHGIAPVACTCYTQLRSQLHGTASRGE